MISSILAILKALPLLIEVIYELWQWIKKVSHNKPEALLIEIRDIMESLNDAKTEDDRKLVARRVSQLWGGMREPLSNGKAVPNA